MVATILLGQANAVHLPLADESIHCMITSSPYYALRDYGLAPTEWPPVTYTPMAGLEPVKVPGCVPGCEHVWGEERGHRQSAPRAMAGRFGDGQGAGRSEIPTERITVASTDQWCQRCGGWRGCLGLEPSPELYVAHIVLVMREVHRVLRGDGTAWLVLGDSYSQGGGKQVIQTKRASYGLEGLRGATPGFQSKQLLGIPWRVAFALQAEGWWLRSDIVYAKGLSFCKEYSGSAMPESVNGWRWERCRVKVGNRGRGGEAWRDNANLGQPQQSHAPDGSFQTDAVWRDCPGCDKCRDTGGYVLRKGSWRPTKSHEMVFMLAKSARYFGDREAVKEPLQESTIERYQYGWDGNSSRDYPSGVQHHLGNYMGSERAKGSTGRNPRTVWAINPGNWPGPHFATYPPALIDPIIRAATPEAGVCSKCGKPWVRAVETTGHINRREPAHCPSNSPTKVDSTGWAPTTRATDQFRPSCDCGAEPRPAIILDPFVGSGTTLVVARKLGRRAIGLDLSYSYLRDQARERLALDALAAWQDGEAIDGDGQDLDELPLFANPKLL